MNKAKLQKDIKLLDESIAHWDRMIRWARTQPQDGKVYDEYMFDEIKERWNADYCSLCLEYYDSCEGCPLREAGNYCEDDCSAWRAVCCSAKWDKWVEKAEEMLAVLENIRDDYAEELGET